MTTTVIRADELQQLATGDRITAIDGRTLTRPLTVSAPLADGRIGIAAPKGAKIEHWLYPDTQIGTEVTVDRPAKTPRQRTMTQGGVKFVMVEPGYWITADGRYSICYDSALTECDDIAHPVRTGPGTGYYCPGGREHEYFAWWVHDHDPRATGKHTWEDPDASGEKIDVADTLRDAVRSLLAHIGNQGF